MFCVLRSTTTDFTVVEPTSKPTIKSLGPGMFIRPLLTLRPTFRSALIQGWHRLGPLAITIVFNDIVALNKLPFVLNNIVALMCNTKILQRLASSLQRPEGQTLS